MQAYTFETQVTCSDIILNHMHGLAGLGKPGLLEHAPLLAAG